MSTAATQTEILAYALSFIPTYTDKRLEQFTRSQVAAPEIKAAARDELKRRRG